MWAVSCSLGWLALEWSEEEAKPPQKNINDRFAEAAADRCPLAGLLRAACQAAGLFLFEASLTQGETFLGKPGLADGLALICTSFWILSFLGCLFEQEGLLVWGL